MIRFVPAARALLVAGALAPALLRADTPDLPFSLTVTEEKVDPQPAYLDAKTPAAFSPVRIGPAFWVFVKPGGSATVQRFQGATIEDAARQPDGTAIFPVPAEMAGGLWYDASTQTLYAPLDVAAESYGARARHEIHLASSTDQGLTWKYLGPILTSPGSPGLKAQPVGQAGGGPSPDTQSGLYWDGGDTRPMLVADQKTDSAYLYTTHTWWPKIGAAAPPIEEHRVARCSFDVDLAPGKWKRWFEGDWSEPGLGGRGSPVNAATVSYNGVLKKYLALNDGGGLAVCGDLAGQDWSPSYRVGDFWNGAGPAAIWATDDAKSDLATSGQDFYVYAFAPARRFKCGLNPAPLPASGGFVASVHAPDDHAVEAAPVNTYGFVPALDSDDPVMARRARRVGSGSAEAAYQGAWQDVVDANFYEGRAKSADAKGAEIDFPFHGHEIYWRAVLGPDAGQADVFLDGKLISTVDCWASAPNALAIAFMRRNLADRDHVIRIVVRGEKNPLSTGAVIRHEAFEYGAETWRASDDFSSVAGKNQWTNLERAGVSDTNLAFRQPDWAADDGCRIGFTRMACGAGDAVRQWLAPHDGTVRVEGAPALAGAKSDELDVSILRNDASAWTAALTPGKPAAACDISLPVKKGAALFFVVHSSAPPPDDPHAAAPSVDWDPVVTYVK